MALAPWIAKKPSACPNFGQALAFSGVMRHTSGSKFQRFSEFLEGVLMLKAVATRFLQTGFAIVLGTACTVAPLMASARGAESPPCLSTIALSELPLQGRITYGLIREGGPFPYAKDGSIFGNRERLLPSRKRGYYQEYTVKTSRSRDRGPQRIVCGGLQPRTPDACYYTRDHYASFHYIIDEAATDTRCHRPRKTP